MRLKFKSLLFVILIYQTISYSTFANDQIEHLNANIQNAPAIAHKRVMKAVNDRKLHMDFSDLNLKLEKHIRRHYKKSDVEQLVEHSKRAYQALITKKLIQFVVNESLATFNERGLKKIKSIYLLKSDPKFNKARQYYVSHYDVDPGDQTIVVASFGITDYFMGLYIAPPLDRSDYIHNVQFRIPNKDKTFVSFKASIVLTGAHSVLEDIRQQFFGYSKEIVILNEKLMQSDTDQKYLHLTLIHELKHWYDFHHTNLFERTVSNRDYQKIEKAFQRNRAQILNLDCESYLKLKVNRRITDAKYEYLKKKYPSHPPHVLKKRLMAKAREEYRSAAEYMYRHLSKNVERSASIEMMRYLLIDEAMEKEDAFLLIFGSNHVLVPKFNVRLSSGETVNVNDSPASPFQRRYFNALLPEIKDRD